MNPDINEQILVVALRQGSVRAFDEIYTRYFGRIYSYCYRALGSRQETEDLVQEVFANLWKYHSIIDPDRSLSVLLYTIASRYRANAFRKLVNSPILHDYVELHDKVPDRSGNEMSYSDLMASFRRALEYLPDKQRRVVELACLYDMDNKTIAERLSINEKTVRNLLSLGKKTMRTYLAEFISIAPVIAMLLS